MSNSLRIGDFVKASQGGEDFYFKIGLNDGKIVALHLCDEITKVDIYPDGPSWKIRGFEDCELTLLTPEQMLGKLTQNVYVFGGNEYGQLGLGDNKRRFIPTRIDELENPVLVSAGNSHSLVATQNGELWGFGTNINGELALKVDAIGKKSPMRLPLNAGSCISGGFLFSAIVNPDFELLTFGNNSLGQLGSGHRYEHINLIPEMKARKVSTGAGHTLIIDIDGKVWVCGSNHYGELGLGDRKIRTSPEQLGMEAIFISAGVNHSAIIDNEGKLWVFGENKYGQLGLEDPENKYVPTPLPHHTKIIWVSAGNKHTLFIDQDGNMYGFGSNEYGQLGLGEDQKQVTRPTQIPGKYRQASAGSNYSIAIDPSHEVWAFGKNNSGQLGLGDDDNRFVPTKIPGLKARMVSAGGNHTLVIPFVED